MKFSVASRIWDPDAPVAWEGAPPLEGWGVEDDGCELEGSAIVAGRLTRRRSVARGHSIWNWNVRSLWYTARVGNGGQRESHTSHSRLNVSRSTNCRETLSSLKFDLYCFNKRLHNSVYSDSGMESLM